MEIAGTFHILSQVVSLTPWWHTFLLSALGALGGTGLALLVAWWQLRKTEAYRRASRWEPMAERLWQERFKVYERMLTAIDKNADAICSGSIEGWHHCYRDVAAAHRRLQVFGGARVIALSVIYMRLNHELLSFAEVHGCSPPSRSSFDALTQAISDIEVAMRIDLGIQNLDAQSEEWFKRTKGEVFHEEWRKIIWHDMGRLERRPGDKKNST